MTARIALTYRDYEALDLPLFTGLGLVPDTLWPPRSR
jgi:hypothetical protein